MTDKDPVVTVRYLPDGSLEVEVETPYALEASAMYEGFITDRKIRITVERRTDKELREAWNG